MREKPVPWTNTMDVEELRAVTSVMESGILSAFIGRAGESFLGGPKVLEIEADFAATFKSRHAISVNSGTTALCAAVAACEVGPGDEVVVTPFTMAATASAIVMNQGVPVFADVCEDTYNLNPAEVEKWITPRTKAIIATNLFGLPAHLPQLSEMARKHNLYLIEDNAQSPGATIAGRHAGTFGHLGVFSLNYHKVIHCGEGGIIVTEHDTLAERCRLLRNHGELVVDDLGDDETIVLGSNYRMTELHAAIAIEQLKKLADFLGARRALATQLTEGLQSFSGLQGVTVPEGYEHSYYVYPIRFTKEVWGISRATFANALKAEGFPMGEGYQKPLYLLPMYGHKRVHNHTQFPFAFIDEPSQLYQSGLCPVAENLYFETLLTADVCRIPHTSREIEQFLEAIHKLWNERGRLLEYEKNVVSCSRSRRS